MVPGSDKPLWLKVGLPTISVGILAWVLLSSPAETRAADAALEETRVEQQRQIFMGGNPSSEPSDEVRLSRLRFPAGSRSNWHTHTDGQLLMLESGRGLTQVRGEPIYEMHPGEPWWTDADVEHWHGAHPNEDALQLTIYEGSVSWLEPVQDDAYLARARRR